MPLAPEFPSHESNYLFAENSREVYDASVGADLTRSAREAEEKAELERHIAEEAAKKAERDARYAARKKRKR